MCTFPEYSSDYFLKIVTTFDFITAKKEQSVMFRCQHDECNGGKNLLELEENIFLYNDYLSSVGLFDNGTTTTKSISQTQTSF